MKLYVNPAILKFMLILQILQYQIVGYTDCDEFHLLIKIMVKYQRET